MHPNFIVRLARVYRDKYNSFGFVVARKWFDSFIPEEYKEKVRDAILHSPVEDRTKKTEK